MKNIVIFASGNGTNVQRIAEYFADREDVGIRRIYCNKSDAYVVQRAKNLGIESVVFNRSDFYETGRTLKMLLKDAPDLIVLAGFLWLIPQNILDHFEGKIINIHPALLPNYGGKGMYGARVHEAVIRAGEKESGITIHYVNATYDDGPPIFQARCPVEQTDVAETLAAKIHALEYTHFPVIIDKLLQS